MSDYIKRADAVTIHEDGTLEVKVPNAQKVGRVLVMDTDSHIGGGLFYPDDAEAELADLPDIPRAYYERIVGNMAHEINILKEQLESADAVPQSEQYKKGFEDAKRAFLIEYARESENMRKRNAQLEVMLNAQYEATKDA